MKNAIEESADKTKKKITELCQASENGIKSANKENASALNIQDKFTVRVSFPEGASCYRTILQKIIRTADTVHQPRPLLLSYESKEKADQQLEILKNLTVNGMPIYAQHEGLPKKDVNVPVHDSLRRKLVLNHNYNIEIVRKFFNVKVEQRYNKLIPTKIFYLTFPTAASASAASIKQYNFYGEKIKLVECAQKPGTYKDLKKYDKGPGKQKSSGSKSEQKTNDKNQTKKTEIISNINGEDTKTDKEISEKIDTNKEICEKIDTNKEICEKIDTNKEICEKIDTNQEIGEKIDTNKEIGEKIDTNKEIDEKVDNDDDCQASDDKNTARKDKEDDDEDVIVEEEVATTSDEIKGEEQTKNIELINEVNNEDTKADKEMIGRSANDDDFEACDKNAEKKDQDGDAIIVEEEIPTASEEIKEKKQAKDTELINKVNNEDTKTDKEIIGSDNDGAFEACDKTTEKKDKVDDDAIVEEVVATASEEIKEKRPPKKKTKKTSKSKADKELAEKTDEDSVLVEKTENSKGNEETDKNSKGADQMGDIMGDIIQDIKSGEKIKQDTSVEEALD